MNFTLEFLQELLIVWEAISNTRKRVSSDFQTRQAYSTPFSGFGNRLKLSSSCLMKGECFITICSTIFVQSTVYVILVLNVHGSTIQDSGIPLRKPIFPNDLAIVFILDWKPVKTRSVGRRKQRIKVAWLEGEREGVVSGNTNFNKSITSFAEDAKISRMTGALVCSNSEWNRWTYSIIQTRLAGTWILEMAKLNINFS